MALIFSASWVRVRSSCTRANFIFLPNFFASICFLFPEGSVETDLWKSCFQNRDCFACARTDGNCGPSYERTPGKISFPPHPIPLPSGERMRNTIYDSWRRDWDSNPDGHCCLSPVFKTGPLPIRTPLRLCFLYPPHPHHIRTEYFRDKNTTITLLEILQDSYHCSPYG